MFLASGPSTESPARMVHGAQMPSSGGEGEGQVWGTWGLAPLWEHVWDILGPEDLPLSKVPPGSRRESPSDGPSSKAELSSLSWTLNPSSLV